MNEMASFLLDTAYFSHCSESDIMGFLPHFRQLKLSAGDTLFFQGAKESAWYLVLTGGIEIQRNFHPSATHPLAQLDSGEGFGEMSMLERIPRMAAAVAIEDSELLCLDGATFHSQLEFANPVAIQLLREMAITQSRRLREITLTLQDLTEADMFEDMDAQRPSEVNQFLFTSILSH